jgi:hypothetical protein
LQQQSSRKCEAVQKLALDFRSDSHLCGTHGDRHDNELLDLADRLCTVAGMIMEDHNLIAVSRPKSADDRTAALDALTTAGSDVSKLIAAAQVLVRLG